MVKFYFIFLLLFIFCQNVYSATKEELKLAAKIQKNTTQFEAPLDTTQDTAHNDSHLSKEQKFLLTNIAFMGGVLAYGFINWDYSQQEYNFNSEEWFGEGTKEGGVDKIGHLYTAYSASRLVQPFYEKWGYSNKQAAKNAALTSFLFTTTMEVGDGFSPFGFAYEDFVSNSLGQVIAYYLGTNPQADEKIDLRFEYFPQYGLTSDPVTHYNAAKYLVALKMAGFNRFRDNSATRYLEFHLGYYARGYEVNEHYPVPERNVYVGIGINIAQILRDLSFSKISTIFNYYQVPYTYISAEKDLND